jgi:hypothetical protein
MSRIRNTASCLANESVEIIIKQKIYLSDNVDAEVESLEALHAEEGAGEDLLDEVPAEVQVLQGAQVLQVHVSNRLNKQEDISH